MGMAARIGDMHVCPIQTQGTPIAGPGNPTVLIGGLPAATLGDSAPCSTNPDAITTGSFTVVICGKPAARMGDLTANGGAIRNGCPTVLIGD